MRMRRRLRIDVFAHRGGVQLRAGAVADDVADGLGVAAVDGGEGGFHRAERG